MPPLLPRFIRVAYRKEPISSFILIVGLVDSVIGGVGAQWSLLSLGVLTASLSVGLRWWQTQKTEAIAIDPKPRRYLPPARQPLPMLTKEHHRR
ncbi:MAG: hypothetical protein ACRC6M_18640 [Microcystaceae cyanobacterium]